MKGIFKTRFVHFFTLLVVVVLALVLDRIYPKLTEGATNALAFMGFWVTVYGLLVAIFEIVRLGSISKDLLKAATSSHNGLKLQLELQEVKSCLEIINTSVVELKSNRAVPIIFISRIKQVYFSVFPEGKSTEEHEKNVLILNSYEHVTSVRKRKGGDGAAYSADAKLGEVLNPYQKTIDVLKRMHDDLSKYCASKNGYKSEVV